MTASQQTRVGTLAPTAATSAATLRVAIDAHMVGEKETGNESYVLNLIRGLAAIDTTTSYLLYSTHPETLDQLGPFGSNFATQRIQPAPSALRIPLGLPVRTMADHLDVLHVTYIAPPISPVPVVASVHDISYVLYPETFSRRDKVILGTLVPLTLKRAAVVLTLSESARRDIVRHYGTPEDKIEIVPPTISSAYRRLADQAGIAPTLARFGIPGRYLLAVGNLQPRKNLPRLIRAFAQLRRDGAYTGKLVLVGKSKWRESDISREVRALGLADEIILTGYVEEEDVVTLYNGADAFVYPSIYEGFGMPPLEAMACGCPVVTGNTSSLPEVVGDAGLMVDPTSVEALAAAIARITCDADLRRTLVERGSERLARFPTEAAARTTLDVYRRAAASRKPA